MKKTVKLIFMRSNMIGSKFIRFMTWSDFSHVGMIMPDGMVIEARYPEGVVMRPMSEALKHASEHEIISIPVKNVRATLDFMRCQLGKKYDTSGLFSFVTKRDWQSPDKWFCSELVASALAAGGTQVGRVEASRVTPQDIYNYPEALTVQQ